MVTWTIQNYKTDNGGGEVATSPEFPGYAITHQFGTDYYLVTTPTWYSTTRPKFAAAEQVVVEHSKLTSRRG